MLIRHKAWPLENTLHRLPVTPPRTTATNVFLLTRRGSEARMAGPFSSSRVSASCFGAGLHSASTMLCDSPTPNRLSKTRLHLQQRLVLLRLDTSGLPKAQRH